MTLRNALFFVGHIGLLLSPIVLNNDGVVLKIIFTFLVFVGLLGSIVCNEKQNETIKKVKKMLKEREGNG